MEQRYSMLYLVPLRCAGRKMGDRYFQPRAIREFL
jgi:hypothetical protein